MKPVLFIAALSILFSCGEKSASGVTAPGKQQDGVRTAEASNKTDRPVSGKGFHSKEVNGLSYSIHVMNGLEFVRRKGETVASEDEKDLARENVVLLEIEQPDVRKDIWKSADMQLSEEDAMSYLTGPLAADLTIEQNGKSWTATGSNFEGRHGAANKLKVQLFFGNLDSDKPMKVLYNDRLFGRGLITFGINE